MQEPENLLLSQWIFLPSLFPLKCAIYVYVGILPKLILRHLKFTSSQQPAFFFDCTGALVIYHHYQLNQVPLPPPTKCTTAPAPDFQKLKHNLIAKPLLQ